MKKFVDLLLKTSDIPDQAQQLAAELFPPVRKFFCLNPDCRRRIFCERLPGLATPYAHKPLRFKVQLSADRSL